MIFSRKLNVIGPTEFISVAGIEDVPAKIDTGADTSVIWATNISMAKDGTLEFSFFGPKSPLYTGKVIKTTKYVAKSVRSSHGDAQIRYTVRLPLIIRNKSFVASFTLTDRSLNNYPVLIGKNTLKGRFMVDVSKEHFKTSKTRKLNQELKKDPYKFHQKYIRRGRA